MENMIKVINDNLRNVMNGIREHKKSLESKLEQIKNDISLKVKEANNYKKEVENSRKIISSLEDEITTLEKDLSDLNEKFGTGDFKEILAAGNKEINSKIIEKQSEIAKQSKIILNLTENARLLKDELVELKSQKDKEEINLEKTKVLEGYFCSRITEIINFSEEHPNDLESLQDQVPQEKLDVQTDIDSNVINTIIDGSIFEEIDEIQTTEPDEKLIQSVLENDETRETESSIEETQDTTDITTTEQLENMISEAKAFVEKSKALHEDVTQSEINLDIEESINEANVGDDSSDDNYIDINIPEDDHVMDPIDFGTIGNIIVKNESKDDEVKPEKSDKSFEEENDLITENNDVENFAFNTVPNEIFFDEESDEDATDDNNINEETTEEAAEHLDENKILEEMNIQEPLEEQSDVQNEDDNVLNISLDEEEPYSQDNSLESLPDDDEEVIDLKIEDDDLPIIEPTDDFIIKESSFVETDDDMNEDLVSLGLDINSFEQDDLILLSTSYDKENTKEFIETMKEHNVSLDNIYKNIRVLVYVTSRNLKQILDLLSKTDAKSEDINKIFKYLDKVNISKLEQVIMSGTNVSMTYALSEAIAYNKDEIIGEILGLDRKEKEILKKNASKEDYKLMNILPDVVKANYDELNKYHVNNAVECITKYPHKFTLTNSVFHQMLDKYDTDDLVRCINKNAAVIDKL